MLEFEIIIVLICVWPKSDFLYLNPAAFLFDFLLFLSLMKQEFPVIHHLANRRVGIRCYLNKIQSTRISQL